MMKNEEVETIKNIFLGKRKNEKNLQLHLYVLLFLTLSRAVEQERTFQAILAVELTGLSRFMISMEMKSVHGMESLTSKKARTRFFLMTKTEREWLFTMELS